MSNWNDERVALLKKLWAEGLSASQVAARIGHVTRNAVISKVHRLGLSGRATTTRKRNRPKKYAGPVAAAPAVKIVPIQWKNPFVPGGPVGAEKKPVEPYVDKPADYVPPVEQMVTFADLEDRHCKFPIGDPRDASFKFCGGKRVIGLPYCECHCALAFRSNATGANSPAGGQTRASPSDERGKVVEAAPAPKLEDA